jgi:hypothetical protein
VADAQARLDDLRKGEGVAEVAVRFGADADLSGKVKESRKLQCDSAQTPITAPSWMSSPPARIRYSLITVSK